jgi:hypothetical protein
VQDRPERRLIQRAPMLHDDAPARLVGRWLEKDLRRCLTSLGQRPTIAAHKTTFAQNGAVKGFN